MDPAKKVSPGIATLIVIVLVGIVSTAVIVINQSPSQATVVSNSQQLSTGTTPSRSTATYADGTYIATTSYSTPGGQESLGLTVTIANNTIANITLDQKAKSGESMQYQSDFAAGYKSLVVGKKVNDISLSRVAGSSLTCNGFNTALDQIKTDAVV